MCTTSRGRLNLADFKYFQLKSENRLKTDPLNFDSLTPSTRKSEEGLQNKSRQRTTGEALSLSETIVKINREASRNSSMT